MIQGHVGRSAVFRVGSSGVTLRDETPSHAMTDENQSDSKLAVDPDRRYRTLVEHASEGIAVVQDARFVFGNPSIAALSGRPLTDFIGRGIADVFHPYDLPRAAARQAARQRGGDDITGLYREDNDIRIIRV